MSKLGYNLFEVWGADESPAVPAAKKVTRMSKALITDVAAQTFFPKNYHMVWTPFDLYKMVNFLKEHEYVAIDTETTGINVFKDKIVGMSLYAPDKAFYIPIMHEDHVEEGEGIIGTDYIKCLDKTLIIDKLAPLLTKATTKLILFNCNFDRHIIYNNLGIDIIPYYDGYIAQSLLDENAERGLKSLVARYLKIPTQKYSELFDKTPFSKIPITRNAERYGNIGGTYACDDSVYTYKLFKFQMGHFDRPELKALRDILFDLEMPVARIMTEAQRRGICVNADYIRNEVSVSLDKEIKTSAEILESEAPGVNFNSPKQVAELMYDKLKLPKVDKKRPRTTDSKAMSKLARLHHLPKTILNFKAATKLRTAFTDTLIDSLVDGVCHASFNTVGAKCVSMDTLVLTNKGIVEIGSLSTNRTVDTFNPIDITVYSRKGPQPATEFYYSGRQASNKVTLSNGMVIKTSLHHPMAMFDPVNVDCYRWVLSRSLTTDDSIAVAYNTQLFGTNTEFPGDDSKFNKGVPKKISKEIAEFIGVYSLAGYSTGSNATKIPIKTIISTDMYCNGMLGELSVGREQSIKIARRIGPTYMSEYVRTLFKKAFGKRTSGLKTSISRVTLRSMPVQNLIGDILNMPNRACERMVPECIMTATKEIQRAYLRGVLFSALPLHNEYAYINLHIPSYMMRKQLLLMFLNFGFAPEYSEDIPSFIGLKFTGNDIFELRSFMEKTSNDCVTRFMVSPAVPVHPSVYTYKTSKYIFYRIKSIVPGHAELCDLVVPSYHSFVGNGILNHNTGRFSCSNPNLQQIPSSAGELIRKAFEPRKNHVLVSIDYSQQELRILAHFSKDANMVQMFKDGKDIHSMVAVSIYNKKYGTKLTYEQFETLRASPEGKDAEKLRKFAKTLNFGLLYGMGANKLADTLEITPREAALYMSAYFEQFPGVQDFISRISSEVAQYPHSVTMIGGRKRRLYPEMTADEEWLHFAGQRQAVNSIIQGSAAETNKTAIIKIQPILKETNSHLLLAIHDEVVLEVPIGTPYTKIQEMADIISKAIPLDVPVLCDCEIGLYWSHKITPEEYIKLGK
jgi:DNA polymerase I-like protein with 3'-5' exonuclease and polymerase domains